MKKMRQTLALLLAGALTVGSFAGCGGSKAGGETAGTETAGTEAAGTAASGSDTVNVPEQAMTFPRSADVTV